ncbi:bifunctional diaminohydroxyphosphoribosylaminopyrimidine deaminase/5-amino-6-(5-phosphoribosylamino)uracil reductase RibD [Pigmentibacter sp. JX0631]|uniref:bifunctional diaminohydroxyphosphoribosylaminopyrimidine deaminase/5-amino-6-(5-phosphoribosylamino)uracil reductase RibD n=1 Tax=Pigmentibacter sp. JX0631 TaxID=2976982 RepID=UPI0024695DF1|nr:bifunctional diaminohydroxyphosphoribosylaminopyrimidine deaminase/5-amino-6-(5-phosphoribosylamino)uracil reductase RibD [Pigmentibacter sp. JX0631]WGL60716.1 bifunctional diaminohydroxyphosphoribosylaminopyrimidine deaminase/5-amino-6-(5-phosphoribosylamino)uracil reductase RibD [Pigmentibacter sp. JX0631]
MTFRLKAGFSFGGWVEQIINQNKAHEQLPDGILPFSDEYFLFKAFLSSMENACIANPNPSVGCLIVNNNQIISYGCTERWGARHAERVAFAKLTPDLLENSSIYVTLEPCTHTGRQPPCVELFKDKNIKKVVIGCTDPNPIVAGQGIKILKSLGLAQVNLSFANEIKAFNYPFFIQQQKKRPFYALKWAQTLDGCLADDFNGWKWISGETSRKYTHWLRQKYDAILVGAGTVLNDFPSLDVRELNFENCRDPIKMIFDPSGKILNCSSNQQKKLKEKTLKSNQKIILFICEKILQKFKNNNDNKWLKFLFENEAFTIIQINTNLAVTESIQVAIENIDFLQHFGRPLQSILVEGGPRLLSAFIDENNFDLIHLFIAPFFLGGEKNRLFSKITQSLTKNEIKEIDKEKRYYIANKIFLNNDILLEIVQNDS